MKMLSIRNLDKKNNVNALFLNIVSSLLIGHLLGTYSNNILCHIFNVFFLFFMCLYHLKFPLGKCLKLLRAKRPWPVAAVVRHHLVINRRRLRPLPKVIALHVFVVLLLLYEHFAQFVRRSCMVCGGDGGGGF